MASTWPAAFSIMGATGDPGAQGAQGDLGPQGYTGPQGDSGPQGYTGPQGQGSQGAQGPAGTNGTAGSQGTQGPAGSQGNQGPAGTNGAAGAAGSAGSTGAQGVQGPAGTGGGGSGSSITDNFSVGIGIVNATGNRFMYSYDGLTWVASSSGNSVITTGNGAHFVKWNGSMWLMGGREISVGQTSVAYSADGINWKASSSGTSFFPSDMFCAEWNGTMWIAGGHTFKMAYSYDGIQWNAITSPFDHCRSIVWNGSMWLAAGTGNNNRIAYSYDGFSWSSSVSGNTLFTGTCYSLAWNGNMWVVGCGQGNNELGYSYDGINWSAAGYRFTGSQVGVVAWNGSIWVAGSETGSNVNRLVWSDDGINWSGSSNSTSNIQIRNLTWNGTLWIAGGYEYSGSGVKVVTSPDGKTWTTSTSGSALQGQCTALGSRKLNIYGVASRDVTDSFMVGVGIANAAGNKFMYSYDGLSWNPSPSGNSLITTGQGAHFVKWNGSIWLMGGRQITTGQTSVAYSLDGINWKASAEGTAIFPTDMFCADWDGTKWVAGGASGKMAYSHDGIQWSTITSLFTECRAIAWNGSMWVAGGNGNDNRLAYSYDGISWTNSTFGDVVMVWNCYTVAWSGIIWVAGGNGTNQLVYSYDGIHWYGITNALFSDFCSTVVWNGSMFVAGSSGGTSMYNLAWSNDGISWSGSSSNTTGIYVRNVAWNGKYWIAGGAENVGGNKNNVMYSTDGKNWSPLLSGSALQGQCCALGARKNVVETDMTLKNSGRAMTVAVGEVGDYNACLVYTYDGIHWFNTDIPDSIKNNVAPNAAMWSVGYNGKMWLAGYRAYGSTTNVPVLLYSLDGIKWNEVVSARTNLNTSITAIGWNEKMWIVGSAYEGNGNIRIAYSYDGFNWTTVPSIFGERIRTIVWNGNMWVLGADASNYTVGYSYDGITWHASANGNNVLSTTRGVVWGKNMWVAACNNTSTKMAYSYDGITWNSGGNPFGTYGVYSLEGYCVAFNGQMWVAGAGVNGEATSNGTFIATSTDGINWTGVTVSMFVYSIVWNGKLWVAGGASSTHRLLYSYDGTNWSIAPISTVLINPRYGGSYSLVSNILDMATAHPPITDVTVTNTISENFMLCLGSPTTTSNDVVNSMYSYDGLNWQNMSLGASTNYTTANNATAILGNEAWCAAWSGTAWIAGSRIPQNQGWTNAAYSSDGVNWRKLPSLANIMTYHVISIAWNGYMWIASGYNTASGDKRAYSYDGLTWTESTVSAPFGQANCFAWNGILWVAATEQSNKLCYSYDGINWTASSSGNSVFTSFVKTVAWGGDKFVACGNGNNQLAYSYDGINWVGSGTRFTDGCYGVAYNGSIWVAVGQGDTDGTCYSTDGISWSGTTNPHNAITTVKMDLRSVAWNGKIFVAAGNIRDNDKRYAGGGIMYSYDGIDWRLLNMQKSATPYTYSVVARRVLNYPGNKVNAVTVQVANNLTSSGQYLSSSMIGTTYILTSTGNQNHSFFTGTPAVGQGFYVYLKNGNSAAGNIDIYVNGTATDANSSTGNGLLYPFTATNNAATSILYYNGSAWKLYN